MVYFDLCVDTKQNRCIVISTQRQTAKRQTMYKSNITKNNDGSFYALVVRVDSDGQETVCRFPAGRHFKTEKGALRFTAKHIENSK